ncbi:LpqN/LpqT family lipoprotein [Mycobacterium sp.]|uniref:LpqN/LpqT family lipoprotein n=1 Tax=Mycobacterium sp. TaxID=1785 RepID=UPI0025F394F8|nr:LpqN/LpqT family lipoprotein [Mycobacterium sp.]
MALAGLSVLAGCTTVVTGSAVKDPGAATVASWACRAVSAQLTSIARKSPAEPQLRIPQPPGWRRFTTLDSKRVWYAMANDELASAGFPPTVVVGLESVPDATDPQRALEQERAGLRRSLGARELTVRPTTVCGYRAESVTYPAPAIGEIPAREALSLVTVGTFGGKTYVATVTIQSTEPGNPTYARDAKTILTGFQMLPPGSG